MHNLEFEKLFPIAVWMKDNALGYYHSKACRTAGASYMINVGRVHALALIPGHAFLDGEGWKGAMR